MSLPHQVLLFTTTFFAGLLNTTVGGGGLLQVPVLLLLFPGTPLATLVGTAKLAGLPGLAGASVTFARRLRPAWPLILRAGAAEIPCAILGARIATRLDPALARPIILVMLAAMSAFALFRPGFGQSVRGGEPGVGGRVRGPLPWLVGAVIGLYEASWVRARARS